MNSTLHTLSLSELWAFYFNEEEGERWSSLSPSNIINLQTLVLEKQVALKTSTKYLERALAFAAPVVGISAGFLLGGLAGAAIGGVCSAPSPWAAKALLGFLPQGRASSKWSDAFEPLERHQRNNPDIKRACSDVKGRNPLMADYIAALVAGYRPN